MVSAIWKDATIATSDETVVVDGNHYFRPKTSTTAGSNGVSRLRSAL